MTPSLLDAGTLPEALHDALRRAFGDRYSTADSVREQHGRGEAPFAAMPPNAVVFARSTQDVQDVLARCHAHRVPVIAFGAGSSLEGQLLATRGGVCIDLSQMNAVLKVDAGDFTATVQAGVTREQLNTALRAEGLFFPVDPGAHASLGGMAATRASGTNTVRYGSMRENVLALTVVLADGRVVQTGTRAAKSAAGYDLTRLFVGSEGTLGIITEVVLRLYPLPESVSAAVIAFPDTDAAVATVIEAIQAGLPIARSEYLCANSIRAINLAARELALREVPTLFLEFHGSPAALEEQVETLRELAAQHGGGDFAWAVHPEDRTRLWHARHNAYFSCQLSRPGSLVIATDTCVPRSRLAESIEGAGRIMADASFPSMIFGHVGDGNFHVLMVIDPGSEAEREEAEALNEAIVTLALSLGGTCTGEHGIGYHKKAFLRRETGDTAIELMQRIKAAVDPHGILNPDKIF
ncbi:FAD-binding oxidoreductase [Paraburkholderia acidisoli]|uniref:D-lactate dehydrogenase (cytochrome) n=1 Tax=Paraburkholderia acidisoli TaxID=2571748 RepID=A0A7Z2GKE4_9BURK|nr:FAD-linked oxidase C-terminal domain-containing protein [Paraburkholderia acidisoli]QGZ63358.1 FAD-binding protein [Paraburkholderia acidisoli]